MTLSKELAQQKLERDYLIDESLYITDLEMPLRKLEEIVSNLKVSLEQARQFVSEQEQELAEQIKMILKLESELQSVRESDRYCLRQEIVEEKERAELLETTLKGQRDNLYQKELAYHQYRELLQKRKEYLKNRDNKDSVDFDDRNSSPKIQQKNNFLSVSKFKFIYILAFAAVLGTLVAVKHNINKIQVAQAKKSAESVETKPMTIKSVNALGYIQPQGEVIRLSPTPTLGGGKVSKLYVQEGELVQAGQIIAVLDNHNSRKADVERAQKEVDVAQANLAIVKAGEKQGTINKQKATIERLKASLKGKIATDQARIARLEVELGNAEREFLRYETLKREGAISDSELDFKRLNLETARKSLQEAKSASQETIDTLTKEIQEAEAELNQITEIRDVDIQKASAEVKRALSQLQQAKAELELTSVVSPIQGQVLKVNTQPGENVQLDEGIVELGKTEQMIVVAEVYESDVSKVRPGQSVKIVSESGAFEGELQGKVSQIGLQIGKNDVLASDPAADVDSRVVEVQIMLAPEDSRRVARLTYTKVIVDILLDSAS